MGEEKEEDVIQAKADYDVLKKMSKDQRAIWKMPDDLPPAGAWVDGKYVAPVVKDEK